MIGTFVKIESSGTDLDGYPSYSVKNRMFDVEIGKIKKEDGLYAYQPLAQYWHQGTIISQLNMEDILKFIQELNVEAWKELGNDDKYYSKPVIISDGEMWEPKLK